MRRLLVLVLALGMIAAACGDDDAVTTTTGAAATTTTAATGEAYPAEMVDAYMEGCIPDGGEDLCRCTIEQYQTRLTFEEFVDYSTTTPDLGTDPLSLEIIEIYLRTVDTTGTTTAGGDQLRLQRWKTSSTPPARPRRMGCGDARGLGHRLHHTDRQRPVLRVPR
jgi:hypothetical protein